MLEKEFKFFRDHQDELVKKYLNRFIVIVGRKVVGDYETEAEAYAQAAAKYKLGSFLIQHCVPGKEAYRQTYSSRVTFA